MKSWPIAVQFSRFGARKILQDRNVILLVIMIYSKHIPFLLGGILYSWTPPNAYLWRVIPQEIDTPDRGPQSMLTPPPLTTKAKRIKSIGKFNINQRLKITKFGRAH